MTTHCDPVLASQLKMCEFDLLDKEPNQITDQLQDKLTTAEDLCQIPYEDIEYSTQELEMKLKDEETVIRFLKSQVHELLCLLGCREYSDVSYNNLLLNLVDIDGLGYDVQNDFPLSINFCLSTLPISPDLLHNPTVVDHKQDILKQPIQVPLTPLHQPESIITANQLPLAQNKEDVDLFTKAEKGCIVAQFDLGGMYQNGDEGVLKDHRQAVGWYEKAALRGHVGAQYHLGLMYQKGEGVAQDYIRAGEWFTEAAEQGYMDAQNKLGLMYRDNPGVPQDFTKSFKWFKKAALQGCKTAQYYVGNTYYNGDGVAQNHNLAFEWYTKSAQQEHGDAQFNLGNMCRAGEGVIQDFTEAVKWYTKAAEQDHGDAQNQLGDMYCTGAGVTRDYTQASKWYCKALGKGHMAAYHTLEKENADVQYQIGLAYKSGNGYVVEDRTAALEWFTKAAQQGNMEAQFEVASSDYYDHKSIGWCIKAAEQGHAQAQLVLGESYENGNRVPQNLSLALEWYTKAGNQGNRTAQTNLAFMYRWGKGVAQDHNKSREWLSKINY